jgi:hypothetical protein
VVYTIRVFGLADRLVFEIRCFRNWICFRPQVKGWETPTLLDLSERAKSIGYLPLTNHDLRYIS